MEKFSSYNDPLSGINPFLEQRRPDFSFAGYFKALLKIPFAAVLFLTDVGAVRFLINIKSNKVVKTKVMAANASSCLDVHVLRYLTGIKNFYYVTESGFTEVKNGIFCQKPIVPCILFPEGCRTNNKAVLQFVRDVEVDHVCGLKYTGACTSPYKEGLRFFFYFLTSKNSVCVEFRKSNVLKDICVVAGLPQVKWGLKDRNEFAEKFHKNI